MTRWGGLLELWYPEHPLSHHLRKPANGLLCLCMVRML
jgi:hypothetical protein